MITVMGASGNTGKVVAEKLLSAGEKIRVIARNAEHLKTLRERGAETFVGDALDAAFLTSAFRGAESAYAMVPPDYTQPDLRKYYARFGESIGKAARDSGIKRMVLLSSIGGELNEGTGPIAGLHDLEERFRKLGVDLLILRPGYFYDNFYSQLGLIKQQGINGGAIEPDVPVPMTATQDVGAAAADELSRNEFRGVTVRELLGPRDYTMVETTRILGEKIGKPDLKYIRFSDADFVGALLQLGISKGIADALVEMDHAISARVVRPLEGRNKRTTMPTSFETFADKLATAYKAL